MGKLCRSLVYVKGSILCGWLNIDSVLSKIGLTPLSISRIGFRLKSMNHEDVEGGNEREDAIDLEFTYGIHKCCMRRALSKVNN